MTPTQKPFGLNNILSALQPYGEQDSAVRSNQHMAEVFAANPDFATKLYGAQNQAGQLAILQQEQREKLRQRSALKRLAEQLQGGGVDRQSALSQYGMITGDLEPMFGIGNSMPAALKEWGAFQAMSPEQKQEYLTMKRSQQIIDTGGGYSVLTPQGSVNPIVDKTLAPNELPQTKQDQAAATEVGQRQGEAQGSLQYNEASLPRLQQVVTELSTLGKEATYTGAGKAIDSIVRQTKGFGGLMNDATDGAIARKEYQSKVDNEVLPLLRETFGAAFTEKEGERLAKTLGDPDASPSEKDAVLRAFIEQKIAQIDTLKRQTGNGGGEAATGSETPRQRLNRLRAEKAAQ